MIIVIIASLVGLFWSGVAWLVGASPAVVRLVWFVITELAVLALSLQPPSPRWRALMPRLAKRWRWVEKLGDWLWERREK